MGATLRTSPTPIPCFCTRINEKEADGAGFGSSGGGRGGEWDRGRQVGGKMGGNEPLFVRGRRHISE